MWACYHYPSDRGASLSQRTLFMYPTLVCVPVLAHQMGAYGDSAQISFHLLQPQWGVGIVKKSTDQCVTAGPIFVCNIPGIVRGDTACGT